MQQQRRRSGIILGLLSLGLLAGAALTAGPVQAVDLVGPYYAEPAWDQKLPADTRFVVLTNWSSSAVLDKETGLVWERSPSSTAPSEWPDARNACTAKTTGNRTGWRLPSIHELASLIDPSVAAGLTLPPGHPFLTVLSARYWSATSYAVQATTVAWVVDFSLGTASFAVKSHPFSLSHAWCVRGDMNTGQY